MVSTEGLVPITRAFLASYYDKYPFSPLSDDVARLSDQIHAMATNLLDDSPPSQGENLLIEEAKSETPHKVDENMWKNREQIEEIIFLLEVPHRPNALQQQLTDETAELASVVGRLQEKFKSTLKTLENFQAKNSEFIFNTDTELNENRLLASQNSPRRMSYISRNDLIEHRLPQKFHTLFYQSIIIVVMTYMPQDFRGTIIRQQKERSERNKQAAVDALISSGGSIHDKYALLWNQQMERRRQLADLGSATGVYKTLVKYLVGVPEALLDFIRQLNDDQGPMEEQRQRYGPPLYSLTRMARNIRLFLSLLWGRLETIKLQKNQISILEEAANVYTSELERFLKFIGEVFSNSPFLITAEDAGALATRSNDDFKEISIPAGQTHEVALLIESINSYIAWDFSLVQGKMNQDIGFSVECMDSSGSKTLILPYRRCGADQGNFCTCVSGNYKLVWDNSYSTFFKKVLRYKVDCIPPVADESVPVADQ